jgi:TolB-like protein
LALLVASAVFYRANAHHAMIAVVPAQWVWAEGSIDASGVALSEVLSAELADTRIARVVAWPIVAQNRDPQPVDRLAHALKASQILAVSVRNTAAGKNVAIFLLDPNTGEKLLAEQYNVPTLATSAAQHELAQRVVRDIASSGRL